ncbi:hypothetical protein F4810DRAFT_654144 [Camillea tinctor]|nr:hypothetical protein F4810DRAFT_654144 [Camillea tinctor]
MVLMQAVCGHATTKCGHVAFHSGVHLLLLLLPDILSFQGSTPYPCKEVRTYIHYVHAYEYTYHTYHIYYRQGSQSGSHERRNLGLASCSYFLFFLVFLPVSAAYLPALRGWWRASQVTYLCRFVTYV